MPSPQHTPRAVVQLPLAAVAGGRRAAARAALARFGGAVACALRGPRGEKAARSGSTTEFGASRQRIASRRRAPATLAPPAVGPSAVAVAARALGRGGGNCCLDWAVLFRWAFPALDWTIRFFRSTSLPIFSSSLRAVLGISYAQRRNDETDRKSLLIRPSTIEIIYVVVN
jgi:hypothetical protein